MFGFSKARKIIDAYKFPFASLTLVMFVNSCYYDKLSELHPLDGYVNTCAEGAANTYTESIRNIIKLNCISCHSSRRTEGGILLESFDQVKNEAASGRLLGVIEHKSGFQAMPPGTSIRDCEINKIQNWIAAGLPQ